MKSKSMCAALLAACCGTATAADPEGLALAGVDAADDSLYVYGGALLKLSGRLGDSGPLVRVWGDSHRYEYGRFNRVDAERNGGHAAFGWQFKHGGGHLSTYLGASYHSVHRDSVTFPGVQSKQSKWGGLVQVDVLQRLGTVGRLEGIAHYDTGFDDYWVRGRLLFDVGAVVLGPEVIAQGNDEYDSSRFGLALSDWRIGDFDTSVAAGWEDSGTGTTDSGYFNLGLAIPY